jgi:alcohol dehydrogenase class IV
MKLSLDTPVQVYEYDRIEAKELLALLRENAGIASGNLKVAAVCDRTPLAERDRILKDLAGLCELTIFDTVEPNPRTIDIMSMFNSAVFGKTDLVLGIGGGSVLDSAKALAMLAANGGVLDQYLGNHPERSIAKPSLPLVLIPTTAGTGSEVTKVGVYSSTEGRKYTLGSPMMMAKSAILAGSILGAIPPKLAAATGFDALDHALESIWNKNASDHTRNIAETAAVEILAWLPQVYEQALLLQQGKPVDTEQYLVLCLNMLRASCIAGSAFSVTGTAAGHALSFVLSEDWHVPHGTACAFTLLDIFDLAAGEEAVGESLARIGEKRYGCKGNRAEKIAQLRVNISALMNHMKMPQSFKDIDVILTREEIDTRFSRAFDDPKMWNQIPKATKENIYPLLENKC